MTKVTGTTATKKAANYTPEMIKTIETMYTGKDNKAEVVAIAAKIGKTPASVRSKAADLGIYVAAGKAKTESGRVKKSDIVADIAKALGGLSEAEQEGLEKATAVPLQKILDRLAPPAKEEPAK